jgi:ABC-type dipeptide/oligopeptide/nickel transport system ATPase component
VVRHLATRVAVVYSGRVVERRPHDDRPEGEERAPPKETEAA